MVERRIGVINARGADGLGGALEFRMLAPNEPELTEALDCIINTHWPTYLLCTVYLIPSSPQQ